MKKQNAALATPPNPAKEKTTWGAVCQQVGFADNLYRTCRDKLGSDFSPNAPFGSGYDEDFEGDDDEGGGVDIRQIRKSAQPVPDAPPDDWKYEPQGIMEQFIYGDLQTKIMLYGGGALVLWFLYDKFVKKAASAPATSAMNALSSLSSGTPQQLTAQMSETAPTTVDIPASLRG